MNLELERVQCEALFQDVLERRYAKYLKDFTRKEFESTFLLGEDRLDEVFGMLTVFIEEALFERPPVIYAQTQRMLKFYKNHLRRKQETVCFLQVEGDMAGLPQLLERAKAQHPLAKVVVTDLRDGSNTFSLLEDAGPVEVVEGAPLPLKVRTGRLIDYKSLFNDRTQELIKLSDLADPLVKAKHEKHLDDLYYLKYKLDPVTLTQGPKPHLESEASTEKSEESVRTINRETY